MTIKIRINIDENDPLFEQFNALKQKTGVNANTEVLRYAIKQTYDKEIRGVDQNY